MSLHTGNENFLSRWARLKRSGDNVKPGPATIGTAAAAADAPIAPLPDLETLSFGDDFTGFLRQEVEESVKRVALKKLFHSAEFNVMDGLDIYIDDYTIPSPIDEATIRQLAHAKDLLFGDEQVAPEPVQSLDGDAIKPAAALRNEPSARIEPAASHAEPPISVCAEPASPVRAEPVEARAATEPVA